MLEETANRVSCFVPVQQAAARAYRRSTYLRAANDQPTSEGVAVFAQEESSRAQRPDERLGTVRERPRRPTLTIASTIHATRAGRSPSNR